MAPSSPKPTLGRKSASAAGQNVDLGAGTAGHLGATGPWARLAFRAVERRAVHELLPPHHRTAAPARLAFAAVGVQRPLEVAGLAVDVDIQRIERRAALAERVGHHLR